MKKYIALFFSVSLFLVSCSDDKTPAGIINEQQMTSLLTDIHLIDGELYNISQTPDSLYKYGTPRYKALFKKYKVTDSIFKKSLEYYSRKPEVIQGMYDKISDNIKAKTDSLNKVSKSKLKNALPE
ncbi:DUF4296 domain-containing protein [Mucilaginibacter segetis]|uniref:DUF4296 domain-containing protein n=1 Tax=Mucilaginibacter segetis TaxID=2793071 RepID=A0A934PW14_9SPHI|nr:DUF4296 domain-containing protein [Mucilaginibacter segetis]MBK0381089.1 DUF4296 domain-containing protein [Mucilaginibacter segetis]